MTDADADKADLHERAGNAAATAARLEVALGHFEAAQRLYAQLGDRSSEARLIARESSALARLRRSEEAWGRLDGWWDATADLGDADPGRMTLGRQIASLALIRGDYELSAQMADRVLGAAERAGNAEMAADNLTTLGMAGFYQGRPVAGTRAARGRPQDRRGRQPLRERVPGPGHAPVRRRAGRPARRGRRGARWDRARPTIGQPDRRDQHPVQRRRGCAEDRRLGLGRAGGWRRSASWRSMRRASSATGPRRCSSRSTAGTHDETGIDDLRRRIDALGRQGRPGGTLTSMAPSPTPRVDGRTRRPPG